MDKLDAFYKLLNIDKCKELDDIIETNSNEILINATAGSGKTTTLFIKALSDIFLKNEKYDINQIMVLSFNKAIANEVQQRFDFLCKKLKMDRIIVNSSTIHALAYKICHKSSNRYYTNIISQTEQLSCINKIRKSLGHRNISYFENTNILALITTSTENYSKNKDDMLLDGYSSIMRDSKSLWEQQEIFEIYEKYQDYKKEHNYLDFSDIINQSIELLNQKPLNSEINSLLEWTKLIMVDEIQDITDAMLELIKKVQSMCNAKIILVGDCDQSIYEFRGVHSKTFLDIPVKFDSLEVFNLPVNRRTKSNILEKAKVVINNATNRLPKDIKSKNPGGTFKVNKIETATEFKDEFGKFVELDGTKAILTRNRNHSTKIMEHLFNNNLKYKCIQGMDIFDNPLMTAILDIMKFIKTSDSFHLLKNINVLFNIPNKTWNSMIKYNEKTDSVNLDDIDKITDFYMSMNYNSLVEFIAISKSDNVSYETAINFIKKLFNVKMQTSSGSSQIDDTFDLITYTFIERNVFSKSDSLVSAIKCLNNLIKKHSDLTSGKMDIFISTIHSVKGMEFDNCLIIDYQVDLKNISEETLLSERKLYYVALTRAKDSATVYFKQYPSIFLKEIYNDK